MRSRSRSDRRLADARHAPDSFAEGLDDLPEGGKPANPELLSLHRVFSSASGTFLRHFCGPFQESCSLRMSYGFATSRTQFSYSPARDKVIKSKPTVGDQGFGYALGPPASAAQYSCRREPCTGGRPDPPENIAPSIVELCLPSMQVSGKIYSYPKRRFLDFRKPGLTRAKSGGTPGLHMSARHEAVGQCLHESDKRVFFCIRQAQPAHEFGVHVVDRLRGRPACRSFTGVTAAMVNTAHQKGFSSPRFARR